MSIIKTCIVCPKGCSLTIEKIEEGIAVSGNQCKRGVAFAVEEMTNPKRTLQTTVKTNFKGFERLSVKTSDTIPLERFFDVMQEAKKVVVTDTQRVGDVIIKDVLGLGVDLLATSTMRI